MCDADDDDDDDDDDVCVSVCVSVCLCLLRLKVKVKQLSLNLKMECKLRTQGGEAEKIYNSKEILVDFTDGEDEHDFLCVGYSSRRALMSCGHSVTPQSLTNWCQRQLDQGSISFVCGVCDAEWSFEDVCKMALLSDEEKDRFEQEMFRNKADKDPNNAWCPSCSSLVIRTDPENLCMKCPRCSVEKERDYTFCFQCLREWKGPAPRSDRCDNDGCVNQALVILKTCPNIEFSYVRDVSNCPSVRACPSCGLLVQHSGKQCKNIMCPGCRVEFCFMCLKISTECLKTSDYSMPCSSGVAPRQTSLPVRR
ncbi:hypothetical protein WMY93_019032 [Mugilogobius chulae]|uniref:RING-type domain-containing protein n=1 Tax=Mugilogobius chulae TaxID=88201 RepID=A0AAW0NIL5_9GOBI